MYSEYVTSTIFPLPFVNNPPNEYDTTFTVLVQSAEENQRNGKEDIILVTFDQPLYQKARYVLSCADSQNYEYDLSMIRVRLGGFHMMMSFLGSIGFIMEGSGLKETFSVAYAENSVEKALLGHAYSRAIGGHFRIETAIANLIFDSMELTEKEKNNLEDLLKKLGSYDFKNDMNQEALTAIRDQFVKEVENIRKRGPTSQLWIQ